MKVSPACLCIVGRSVVQRSLRVLRAVLAPVIPPQRDQYNNSHFADEGKKGDDHGVSSLGANQVSKLIYMLVSLLELFLGGQEEASHVVQPRAAPRGKGASRNFVGFLNIFPRRTNN